MRGIMAFLGFAVTVPLANWMIGNVGECIPNGPCLIPVGFGLTAPSGVLMIGAAMVLRDAVHSIMGWKWAFAAILIGAGLSAICSPPALVFASVAAFVLSEVADFAIYAPLRKKNLSTAVFLSGSAGAVIDSAIFLVMAFGSMDFIAGQVVGKMWATVVAALVICAIRRRAIAEGRA